jgi:hypothetical protein
VDGAVLVMPVWLPVDVAGLLAQAARRETAARAAKVVIFIRKTSLSWVREEIQYCNTRLG